MKEDYKHLSDEELVVLSLQAEKFFAELIARYKGAFFRYLKRFVGFKDDELEDVMQKSFIKIYYHLNSFNPKLKFSSWAYRIVRNEAIDELRRKNRDFLPLLSDFDVSDNSSLEEDLDRILEKEKVKLVLAELRDKYREVMILRHFEHLDYQEISDILEKPIGSVCSLLNRAKKEFKLKYEKYAK